MTPMRKVSFKLGLLSFTSAIKVNVNCLFSIFRTDESNAKVYARNVHLKEAFIHMDRIGLLTLIPVDVVHVM